MCQHYYISTHEFQLQKSQKCPNTLNIFISDLADTTRTNPILWSNLNYEKTRKCADASAIIISDLNFKSCLLRQCW